MRSIVLLLSISIASNAIAQTASITPDALVQRGVASYRAGDYAAAAKDLSAASDALLSQEQMQNYVNTGKFPGLDRVETALVYLALAQSKLGHTSEAREAVLRLNTAERIDTTYAQLNLGSDAAEFEKLAAKLVPGTSLKSGAPQVAQATPPKPEPAKPEPAKPEPAKPAAPAVAEASMIPALSKPTPAEQAPAPKPTPAPSQPVQTQADIDAERQRVIDRMVADERAKIQQEADERVAMIQKIADERVAQVQKDAAAQIAVLQEQIRRNYLLSLRQADDWAASGNLSRANDIYNTIASTPGVARGVVAEAAVGLYRTGAYRDAVSAFGKLGQYLRGEEDLRYYHAVSLYETGDYAQARHELACALPYIQVTDAVNRYRDKIERTRSRQAAN